MPDIAEILRQGTINLWLFVPVAIALGALHGLEPGHSKTMMAAFIVAVRGTLRQAALLGIAATLSHTAVVWVIALGGMYIGNQWSVETSEPYLEFVSGVLILGVAVWMFIRIWRENHQEHDHSHDHSHHDSHHQHDHHRHHDHDNEDAHARAHAAQLRQHFANGHVTTGQIILFGLTGGLIPCPAAITVLLLCMQLREIPLGALLVFCFSIGLAMTLVLSGSLAALSVRYARERWSGFEIIARKAPYLSCTLIVLIGGYVSYQGLAGLMQN